MLVCILGPLILREGSRTIPAGGPLQRRVLARLAMDAGSPVSAEDLESALWGEEPPSSSRHTIALHIFRLRRLGLAIDTQDGRYVLRTPTDLADLERLTTDGRTALEHENGQVAAGAFRSALELVRGRPLADLEDLPEARIHATRIEDLLEGLQEELLICDLQTGQAAEFVPRARQLATERPYRERRWALLMLSLYRAGRQADALSAYGECRRRLIDDLGLDPGPVLRRMQQAVLAQDPALNSAETTGAMVAGLAIVQASSGPESVAARIPGTSTRLIGRVSELRDLADVWDRARFVTLIGPPGAGKTRLALELARKAPPPVWYVALDHIPDTQPVADALLDAVAPSSRAVGAIQDVIARLRDSQGLVVLDGAEKRLSSLAPIVEALLAACPRLRILATSRERLGLADEAIESVGPLEIDEALDLLVDRARLLDAGFQLGPDEVSRAERLCTLVDRLPLGLELVAKHLHLLRLDEVVARVESDMGRWAGGPIGTRPGLWAALDSSVEGLRPPDRQAMLALSVMVAGADLALIEAVAGFDHASEDGFDVVARLVDVSLVQVRSAVGATRYELLNTVATHTLESAGEADIIDARQRYEEAVLERAKRLAPRLASAARSETLRLLDDEMPHVREVLGRLAAAPFELDRLASGLQAAVGLTDYWLGRHPAEGLSWIGKLLEAAEPTNAFDPTIRAAALLARGHLAYWVTDFVLGAVAVDEAQRLFSQLGDHLGEGRALRRRGAIAAATDDLVVARRYFEASRLSLEQAGVEPEIGITLLHLGSLLADEGQVVAARPVLERAYQIAVATGDPLARGHVLAALTLAHWKAGSLDAAMQSGNEALLIFRELSNRPAEGNVAYRLAAVARGLGRPRAARRYAELAVASGDQSGTRTTIALGHVNLARLDMDRGNESAAARNLLHAFEVINPQSDRWVLVEALEAAARLLVATDRASSMSILGAADRIRTAIRQPVASTEADDRSSTIRLGRSHVADPTAGSKGPWIDPLDATSAYRVAERATRELLTTEGQRRSLRDVAADGS